MKIARLSLALAIGILVAAGCGEDRGESSTSTSTNSTSTTSTTADSGSGAGVEVGLKEYAIVVEAPSVGAGEVKFEADNEGKIPHELVVLKTDTKAGDLKVSGAKAVPEGENLGAASDVGPGEHKDVEVDLEPGHYILLCNLPGHYQQGMHTDLDIK
jgi:uncharacterized cupredoxin-like copper-binding protein